MPIRIEAREILHDPAGFVSGPTRRPSRPPASLPALGAILAETILLGVFAVPILLAAPASAQSAEVIQEENFRNEPNGGLLAVLAPGVELTFHGRRENWVEATMEGWVWSRSLLTTERTDYDLVVSTGEGENLRDRPSGEILGRLEDGTFLQEVERIPGWIRVRRRGWIWSASVTVDQAASAPGAAVSPVPLTQSPPGRNAPNVPEAAPNSAARGAAGGSGSSARSSVLRAGRGLAVLSTPNGDTLSILDPGAEITVIGREGNWARVRIDGWVWQPDSDASGSGADADPNDPGPTLDQVVADPAGARGRIVTWSLQYVSLEQAEGIRTDFFEGEPYLLMRPPGSTTGRFVYVAIPPERVEEVDALVQLRTLTVVGRVRTGASRITGSPILDLIEIR